MLKKVLTFAVVVATLAALSPLSAVANDSKSTNNTSTMKTTPATETAQSQTPTKMAEMPQPIANTIAVCGCGKIFETSAKTPYITYEGKTYACCSEECHQMAMKDPKKAAAMAEANTARVLGEVKTDNAKTNSASK